MAAYAPTQPVFLGDAYTVSLNSIPGAANFGRTAGGVWLPLLAASDGALTVTYAGTVDQDVNLVSVGGAAIAIGQAAMAASLPVAIASNQSAITVQVTNTANNITTSTTTVVKSGAGVLHGINVNSLGTVASAVTVYDNTAASGTKLATIDSLTLKGWNQYDVAFATGLTVVTTGTAAPDITVSYR